MLKEDVHITQTCIVENRRQLWDGVSPRLTLASARDPESVEQEHVGKRILDDGEVGPRVGGE
ncbi:hypothetical protein [Demequina sp. NBRC 110055]|uniref:hypothetical protein n=1 Tax=Demequina sp. NBRC 110055 TaxID=1570344 RepID=UPI001F2A2F88|nr:hypothetical protein [Demequina sp. NBRC 110055]